MHREPGNTPIPQLGQWPVHSFGRAEARAHSRWGDHSSKVSSQQGVSSRDYCCGFNGGMSLIEYLGTETWGTYLLTSWCSPGPWCTHSCVGSGSPSGIQTQSRVVDPVGWELTSGPFTPENSS